MSADSGSVSRSAAACAAELARGPRVLLEDDDEALVLGDCALGQSLQLVAPGGVLDGQALEARRVDRCQ